TGEILLWHEPAGEGVRVDSGIRGGDQVSIYYDPLLAKIVAYGPDRAVAIRRLVRALERTALLGVQTNLTFLRTVLDHPAFQAGAISTAYLAEYFAGWTEPTDAIPLALIAATLAQWVQHPQLDS